MTGVEIVSEEPFVAFVSSYGGFSSQSSVISHAAELGAALKDAAFDIEEDFYFSAGYDPPFRIFNRHNEVWVMEKSSEKKGEMSLGLDQVQDLERGTFAVKHNLGYDAYDYDDLYDPEDDLYDNFLEEDLEYYERMYLWEDGYYEDLWEDEDEDDSQELQAEAFEISSMFRRIFGF
eukprot:CAMPEP_0177606080 /NCGR_PEP_ID=MMETSP0419_2-20121207/17095_1 /TAXON_ID=582737 /ORGANISM="Tetraselmis sp., Strain GSL018" /LENGTH=175 /DNA_ID=CAMNT_0019100375 /DNA_START=768 /DNA_END=1294 /DNA_ORIENTATION=-